MATWSPRFTAPASGTPPYDWNAGSKYQCTWYAYWRVQQGYSMSDPPCWYSGHGTEGYGAYTDAKYWLENYRSPWIAHPISDGTQPTAGDIIIFTGNHGHCVVVEVDNGNGSYQVSDYNLIGGPETFGFKADYTYGNRIYGYMNTGACIGYLHYPDGTPPGPEPPEPPSPDVLTQIISGKIIKDKEGVKINVRIYKQ